MVIERVVKSHGILTGQKCMNPALELIVSVWVNFVHFMHCSSMNVHILKLRTIYRKWLFGQKIKHVSVFWNSNVQLPYIRRKKLGFK